MLQQGLSFIFVPQFSMAMLKTRFNDLGRIAYAKAWDYQAELFNQLWEGKKNNSPDRTQHLLFCEHNHVYTLGKSGKDSNLLVNEEQLKKYGAELFHIDRGGDITYHGPGQLVAYPIFDLQAQKLGVKNYVHLLEEVVIQSLQAFDIEATRLDGATGVWLDAQTPKARKICAIGVKASHFITMHGFAFNINTDLNFFNHINPCGFTDKGVTSLSKELDKELDMNKIKELVLEKFTTIFDLNIQQHA
jgi:lipoyl(octanoyl) transferase